MTKKLILLAVLGIVSALPAYAYKWYYGANEFCNEPGYNTSGTAYTAMALGSYDITFNLLTYCTGSIKDAWATEIKLYMMSAAEKDESKYELMLLVKTPNSDEMYKLRSYCEKFRMYVEAQKDMGVFIDPTGKSVSAIGTDTTHYKDTLNFTHQKNDEAAYAEIRWVPSQRWSGKQVKFKVVVNETNGVTVDHTYTHYVKGLFSTGSYDLLQAGRPMLIEPTLCNMPGKLEVTYIATDSVVDYTFHRYNRDNKHLNEEAMAEHRTSTKDKPLAMAGAVALDADDYSYRMDAIFKLSRLGKVTDTLHATPYNMIFPAYHSIHNFQVVQDIPTKGAYAGIYRGYKKLTWEIHHVNHEDVYEDDMFEIQRAYDPNFKTAQTVAIVPFNDTEYSVRDSLHVVGNETFPCQLYTYIDSMPEALNCDTVYKTMYYRIRRTTTSLYENQWPNKYSQSNGVTAPIFLAMPYLKEGEQIFSYAEDYATQRNVNIRVPFTPNICEGHYFWWDGLGQVILTRYWRSNPTPDDPNPEVQSAEILVPQESMVYENGRWYLKYTDKPNFPCVNYSYSVRVERGGSMLPLITYETVSK